MNQQRWQREKACSNHKHFVVREPLHSLSVIRPTAGNGASVDETREGLQLKASVSPAVGVDSGKHVGSSGEGKPVPGAASGHTNLRSTRGKPSLVDAGLFPTSALPRHKSLASSSLFMKSGGGAMARKQQPSKAVERHPPEKKKKAAVLDVASVARLHAMTTKRREDLQKQKEEEKEAAARERAEALQAEKKAEEEHKKFLKELEKQKKEREKERLREEKHEAKKAREEERQKKRQQMAEERQDKRMKIETLDPSAVSAALKRARLRADIESTKEIQDPSLQDAWRDISKHQHSS